MNQAQSMPLEMKVRGAEISQRRGTYHAVKLMTSRGDLFCREYKAKDATSGVVWLNGTRGGWSSPAKNVYPRLARTLISKGIASLQLAYRHSNDLNECVLDTLAGIAYLEHQGITKLGLVGHSFGGAVAIQAGTISGNIRTVVTLVTQSYGATHIGRLHNDCAILLIHGSADHVLPPTCSEYVFERAHEPKTFICLDGADHTLDNFTSQIHVTVRDWLISHLNPTN